MIKYFLIDLRRAMENMYYNPNIKFNKKISVRKKCHTNAVCSCVLLGLIKNKIMTVTEISL